MSSSPSSPPSPSNKPPSLHPSNHSVPPEEVSTATAYFGLDEGVTLQANLNNRVAHMRDGKMQVLRKRSTLSNAFSVADPENGYNSIQRSFQESLDYQQMADVSLAPVVVDYDPDTGKPLQKQVSKAGKWSILHRLPSAMHKTRVEDFANTKNSFEQGPTKTLSLKELEDRAFSEEHLNLSEGTHGLIRRSKIAVAIMQLYLNSGACIHRVEMGFEGLTNAFGLRNTSVYVLWNAFLVSLRHPITAQHLDTDIFRAPFGLDLGKLSAVNRLVMDLPLLTIAEAEQRVTDIASRPPLYPSWLKNFICLPIISCMFGPMFFDGDWWSGLFALVQGFIVGCLYALQPYANPVFSDMLEFIGGMINGFVARIVTVYAGNHCFNASVMAGCVWLIPGFPLTMGILELVSKGTANGVARVASALITVIILGFGIGFGSYLAELIPTVASFIKYETEHDLKCVAVNPLWDFLLYPISAVATAVMLEAEYWQWPLIIPPAGFSFGIWYALQQPPNDQIPFTVVVLLASLVSGIFGFGYAKITQDSAFPIIYMAFQYIVPGGLALKTILGSLHADLVPGAGFAARMLQALIGCMLGTYLAQLIVWPKKPRNPKLYR